MQETNQGIPQLPKLTRSVGDCQYCGDKGVELVAPSDLRDHFESLIDIYTRSDSADAKPLIDWLAADWGLFARGRLDRAHAKDLLGDILDDGDIVRRLHLASGPHESQSLQRWQEFREELMHRNRYFPKTRPDLERLRELLDFLVADPAEIPETLYRARLQDGAHAFEAKDMGAPPAHLAMYGRANPAGIPYLYLASDPTTAIAETRPHTGDLACVADFAIARELKLADLRDPRRTISPFAFGDEDIRMLRSDLSFLVKLGDELTRPVQAKAAHVDYVPSQYLCEFIKDCGFDGVIYRSAVGDGSNFAIFDAGKASAGWVAQSTVARVRLELGHATGTT